MKLETIARIFVILLVALSGMAGARFAWAASTTTSHQVAIQIPQVLSVTADISGFTLTLNDFVKSSSSNVQTIQYTVKSNANAAAAGATIMKAKLGTLFQSVDLLAQTGTYVKQGGNASLTAAAAGQVTILTADTGLAKKVVDSGNGRILFGTIPVQYQALAQADLGAGTQTATLTVTFSDI
ncbi:MAG: hypothetical protein A2Y02_01365 [Omnitrophica bacterium GWA2_52_12]|nr:MAG: hypothetical protein A2Y02_01365 [Omnitrophica bacterium GWA2_52_12]